MIYEKIANLAGWIAATHYTPFLVLHSLVCLILLAREWRYFFNLRNLIYTQPKPWLQVLPCLLIAYHYFLETINFLFYLSRRFFTSKGFLVHHIFCLNMVLFGIQTKLFNLFTIGMQITHGIYIASLLLPAEITVVACNWYYYTGVAAFGYHLIALFCVKMNEKERLGAAGMTLCLYLMGGMGHQEALFQYCENAPDTSPQVVMQQIAAGCVLAAISVLPALYITFRTPHIDK